MPLVPRCLKLAHLAVLLLLPGLAWAGPDQGKAAAGAGAPAKQASAVKIVVLREHGVGAPAHAQQYLDEFIKATADLNGWSQASGKYHTRRSMAESHIEANKPQFGILTLGAFLALRKKHSMKVIGRVDVAGAGGRQYFIVSKSHKSLDGCRGKSLATDHAEDVRFVEKVVARGKFKLADFTLVPTRRPVQTIKKVTRKEAECALIDDAQNAHRKNVEGGEDLEVAWTSAKLPPMVIVSFPKATAAETRRFRANLARVCTGAGREACRKTGMRALLPATEVEYRTVIRAYGG
jgi:hypothetical protein